MSWLDDLSVRTSQSLEKATASVYQYLDSRVSDAVVKVGNAATGNQSAAQLAQGQMGGQNQAAVPASGNNSPALLNSISSGMFNPQKIMSVLPILAVAGIGAYFLMGKKRGRRS